MSELFKKSKDGAWQFNYTMDGKQRSFYLGTKYTQQTASKVESVVSDLLLCRYRRESPRVDLLRRFEELPIKAQHTIRRHRIQEFRGDGMTLGELIDLHRDSKRGFKAGTKENYEYWYRDLTTYFGEECPISTITPARCNALRQWCLTERSRRRAEAGVNRIVLAWRNIFKYAVEAELMYKNPFSKVKSGLEVNKNRQFYVGRDVLESLLPYCKSDELRFALLLGRYAGLRIPSEIRYMKFSDFKGDTFVIHHDTKTGSRTVPFFFELRKIYARIRRGRNPDDLIFPETFGKASNIHSNMRSVFYQSGVEKWPKLFNNLRSSCITDYYLLGYSDKTLNEVFGNSSIVRYRHYVQFLQEFEFERMLRDSGQVVKMLSDNGGQFDIVQKVLSHLKSSLEKSEPVNTASRAPVSVKKR